MMCLKLALAAGSKIIITSSSDGKLKHVQDMAPAGVIQTINYRTSPNWEDEVIRLNGGVEVDLVVENGGMSSIVQSLKAVTKGGTISQVGYLGKQNTDDLTGFVSLLIDKTANLRGINVGSRRDFERLNNFIATTGLRFEDIVHRVYPVEHIQDALDTLQSGSHIGKIIVTMGS